MSLRWLRRVMASIAVVVITAGIVHAQPGLVLNADLETDTDADGIPNDWFHSSGVSYPNDNGPIVAWPEEHSDRQRGTKIGDRKCFRSFRELNTAGRSITNSCRARRASFRTDLRFFDGGRFQR